VAFGLGVAYEAYVQNIAWQGWRQNWLGGTGLDALAGTVGQSLRVEAFHISLQKPTGSTGSICYQAHVQNYGWMAAVCDGAMAGTTGQSLRVEAMRVWLTGAAAGTHVCYRAQVENLGWLGELCDGANMGTAGQNLRLEAFQIKIWK